jgi:cyclophilin family peptidyl-prolyl cis-trans isomerase
MELATADQMPHTVHWFLEQVDTGMYNFAEFAFTSSAEHVVLAKPVTEGLLERLDEYGLYRIMFPEYSSEVEHVKYSVGLSGRPGGPNFYINMDDNSRSHGPGGYAADGSADPCFGRITRGFDAIDRLHSAKGDVEGGWTQLNPNVYILSVKLLSSK